MPTSSRRGCERVRRADSRPALAGAEAQLRGRDHRWRGTRPGHRLLPGHPSRPDRRRGRRGRLHRFGQHGPEHDHHPGQLRDRRVGPLLPARPRPLRGTRGGDRLVDHAQDQGPAVAGPHRVGPPRRAGPHPAQPGDGRPNRDGHTRGGAGPVPAPRSHRRRPLSGAGRLVSPGRGDRAPRPGRLGLRPGGSPAWDPYPPAHPGYRAAPRRGRGSPGSRPRPDRFPRASS